MESPAEVPPEEGKPQKKTEKQNLEEDLNDLLVNIREKEEKRNVEVKEFARLHHVIAYAKLEIQKSYAEEDKKQERINSLEKELLNIEKFMTTTVQLETDPSVLSRKAQIRALEAQLARLKEGGIAERTHIEKVVIPEKESAITTLRAKLDAMDADILDLQHLAMDMEEKIRKMK